MPDTRNYSQEVLERSFGTFASDADFWSHAGILDLGLEELESRSVLEIGSGKTNRFAREGQTEVRMGQIVTINTQLASVELCRERDINPKHHGGAVVALAQGYLPFRDNSFDTVISLMGVPKYLLASELPDFFEDVRRVLKPGGVAKFWPVATISKAGDEIEDLPYESDMAIEEINQTIIDCLPEPFNTATTRLVFRPSK